jgi:diguanylate cyclase (GGDEF)-like protein/PAS domain S-box-containing protein
MSASRIVDRHVTAPVTPRNQQELVADANPLGFILVGPQRRVLRCGGVVLSEIGLVADQAVGEHITQLFPDHPQVVASINRAYLGQVVNRIINIKELTYELSVFPASGRNAPDCVLAVVSPVDDVGFETTDDSNIGDLLARINEGVVTADQTGRIVTLNAAAERILGVTIVKNDALTLKTILPDILTDVVLEMAPRNTLAHLADGSTVSVSVSAFPSRFEGERAVTVIITDMTERETAKRALAACDARYALVSAGANDGLWEWNLEDGTVHFSTRWRMLLGLEKEAIKHTPEAWLSRIHPNDVDIFCNRFDAHLEGETSQFEHEYRMRHANGEYRWVQARGIVARRENSEPFLMAGSQADITDRKLAEDSLTHGAMHDALTGLPNRGLMLDRIGQALARMKRSHEHRFALAIFDLDRFMVVNESLGHAAGDELLVSLARRLEPHITPGNTLARLGGDEFAILIEEFESLDEAKETIGELQSEISQPFKINGEEIFISASFGVAVGAMEYTRSEELLRDADLAMYRAKKESKSGFETFDRNRHRRAVNQLQVETMLRRALDNGDIVVHYQPIVDLRTGTISGFEALTRLEHPTRGLVPPGEFIDIAEETGLIVPLGEQVLEKACAIASEWQRNFDLKNQLSMSVNFSARHISEDNVVGLLESALDRSGLPPENLKIEITESLIMTNPELAAQTFAKIKELGVTLSLDDFGTGYSSLSYLRRFPIDTLKMDRSFVGRMDTDERDLELVRMIILLAHTLGMDVIGEGIETASQLGLLRDLNCEYGQGYLFAQPLPADAAAEMLATAPVWS